MSITESTNPVHQFLLLSINISWLNVNGCFCQFPIESPDWSLVVDRRVAECLLIYLQQINNNILMDHHQSYRLLPTRGLLELHKTMAKSLWELKDSADGQQRRFKRPTLFGKRILDTEIKVLLFCIPTTNHQSLSTLSGSKESYPIHRRILPSHPHKVSP